MTRILISTNHRGVLNDTVSGWLYVVDLKTGSVLKQTYGVEPPYRIYDANPRGGMRGMRGMSFHNGELAIANYSSILFFDCHWNLLRIFTHPSIAAIHEIFYTENGVWATSTANDVLAHFEMDGSVNRLIYMRTQKQLMRKLGGPLKQVVRLSDLIIGIKDFRTRTYFNLDLYDRTHLNSICQLPDGRLLLSLGLLVGDYFGLLINIKTLMLKLKIWDFFLEINQRVRKLFHRNKQMLSELAVQPAKGKSAIVSFDLSEAWQVNLQINTAHNPSHSVRILSDGTVVYLNTSYGQLINFDLDGKILSNTKVADKFLRGLLELPDGRLVLGGGNDLLIFDRAALKIVDQIELSNDLMNTIFDIQIMPPDFDMPPASLQDKIGRIVGYDGQKTIFESTASL